jgi:hypothetical protein
LSLYTAGLLSALVLLAYAGFALFFGAKAQQTLARLPRSQSIGIALLAIALVWTLWLVATMEMGEFSSLRRPLLIALPIGFLLAVRFVNEFLAVRALGMLCLLVAEPLLEAAFFRDEISRLLVTTFAYLIIVAGLFWVASPYLLRDKIAWLSRSPLRWRMTHAVLLFYGLAVLVCTLTFY